MPSRLQISAVLGVLATLALGLNAQAGDLLRGGAAASSPSRNPGYGIDGTAAAEARANAKDSLARTTQAVQSVQAMQEAARELALRGGNSLGKQLPTVPNGLKPSGLEVAPGVPANLSKPGVGEDPKLWQGAKLPIQTTLGNRTVVSIEQLAPQAILNWQTFNIGKNTTLQFRQGRGGAQQSQWIAFNKINDPTGSPTQILGNIEATGQVYVINQNGIIFGGASQINVHALVASSLPINDDLIASGLLNNPKAEFLFSAPTTTDPAFALGAATTYTLAQMSVAGSAPTITFPNGTATTTLISKTDFTFASDGTGKTKITFTTAGLAKVGAKSLTVSYFTPTGDVVVNAGAQLSSPTTPEHVGGRVTLVGPSVTNAGGIATPDGQTILAAGLEVGFVAHASSDPSLRGLDVFVGAEGTKTGTATNSGLISAERASVVMMGKEVDQLGAIDSTTSVTLNGRIDLLANYDAVRNQKYDPKLNALPPFFFRESGTVSLGPGSVMQILPEVNSDETVASAALPLTSQVNLQGLAIHAGPGSSLLAPNADVALLAGRWADLKILSGQTGFFYSSSDDRRIQPQIYLDRGAMIDVAGTTGVPVPIGQNILAVEARGSELADAPLQRTGVVRGKTIHVDLRLHGPWDPTLNGGAGDYAWVGTPLANARGYRDLIERSAGELTTKGGTVQLHAGGSVVLQPGSIVDVSGGSVEYQGGIVETTRLWSGGQLLDISQATPDRVYDGIYTATFTIDHPKYGISETFAQPLALTGAHFEQGYTQGAAGGSIAITAPAVALDGTLRGATIAGPRQRSEGPAPSSLAIAFRQQDNIVAGGPYDFSPTPPSVVFRANANLPAVGSFAQDDSGSPAPLRDERQHLVVLSPELLGESGFGKLTIENLDGGIFIPQEVKLEARAGSGAGASAITLKAANLRIDGEVVAPGGSLAFEAHAATPFQDHLNPNPPIPIPPTLGDDRGRFALGATAALNTAGLIVDERFDEARPDLPPLAVAGGSISIKAYDVNLVAGSTIDVSGGVAISATGKRTFGDGGAIEIKAAQDPGFSFLTGGKLVLGAELRGYSGAKGGSLALQTNLVQVGGQAPPTRYREVDGKIVPRLDYYGQLIDPDTFLLLAPEFFNQGGFTSFAVTSFGPAGSVADFIPSLVIAPGTVLAPRAQSLALAPFGSGTSGARLEPVLRPEAERSPVSLSFTAAGVRDSTNSVVVRGDLLLGLGATISTDPLAKVSLKGDTVTVLGSVFAPGGTIEITGKTGSANLFFTNKDRALVTVNLGRHSVLSTAGTSVIEEDGRGFRTGRVFGGGTITVTGNLLAERGALLDVSGASAILDLPPQYSGRQTEPGTPPPTINPLNGSFAGRPLIPTRVDSDGGSITLSGGQILFSDATLRGAAGGPSALGGSITISSGIFPDPGITQTPLDVTLTVTQGGRAIPDSFDGTARPAIGRPILNVAGKASGGGYVTVNSFAPGGFDFVNLKGTVNFQGPIALSAGRELRVADGGVLFADGETLLTAPYVALGQTFTTPLTLAQQQQFQSVFVSDGPYFFGPTSGRGHLTVVADLIDVGNLSLQGISTADLLTGHGEIRGNGTLDIAGSLTLQAAQVYPTTAASFTLAAYDKNVFVASSTVGDPKVTLGSAALPPGFGVGSPLLGSTVQQIDGTQVTLAAGANASINGKPIVFAPGSGTVTIAGGGTRALPLSAGGTLSIYASVIEQSGGLFAPGGTINLGWDGSGTPPKDFISGAGLAGNRPFQVTAVPITQTLNLNPGSITSVSLVNSTTGEAALIPYGLNVNGSQWIDPLGTDITAGGVAAKNINLGAIRLTQKSGSLIDLSGGGDLFAYQWIPGIGGSKDVLASTTSFAMIPGYGSAASPFAPFAKSDAFTLDNPSTGSQFTDPGYVNARLHVGDRVYLGASAGLAAGNYTLLPARYALLPGAFLVTPQSALPLGSFAMPDGSSIVSGYRFNGLSQSQTGTPLSARFEVASGEVVRARSQYGEFLANDTLTRGALVNNAAIPRLPGDAGYLLLEARTAMSLMGDVAAKGLPYFHDGTIDISSLEADILIGGANSTGGANQIVLDAGRLSKWNAESLLIGGVRHFGAEGATITVTTGNVTVDNAGAPLFGAEIILVANHHLTLEAGAKILQIGSIPRGGADTIFLGNAAVPGSGDGVLLRLTSDLRAQTFRAGVNTADLAPTLTIQGGVRIAGNNLLLDSTAATSIAPDTRLDIDFLSLNSGQIVLQLDPTVAVPPGSGLVLTGPVLEGLGGTRSLSLLSYRSLDIYGTGSLDIGGALTLHAAEIRGFENGGGTATIRAGSITLDNRAGTKGPGPDPGLGGALAGALWFDTSSFRVGAGDLQISQFQLVEVNAARGLFITGSGSLSTQGDFHAATPLVTGAQGVKNAIVAVGDVIFDATAGGAGGATNGLGATLTVRGASIVAASDFIFHSGSLTLEANGPGAADGVTVGGRIDTSGTARIFNDVTRTTSGGEIRLLSASGEVTVAAAATLDVSAPLDAGNAGLVLISAPQGDFILDGKMFGKAGLGGQGGSFSLEVKELPDTATVATTLAAGGFDEAQSFRVRVGDVTIGTTFTAHDFNLSTDAGTIRLTAGGTIDASGATGGKIRLVASESVVLENGSVLTVEGDDFDHAGKGGSVSLEAGASVLAGGIYTHSNTAAVDLQSGSTINLGVKSTSTAGAPDAVKISAAAALGKFTGTLHLRAPQDASGTSLQVLQPVLGDILGAPSKIVVEGYRVYQPGGSIDAAEGQILGDGLTFGAAAPVIGDALFGAANPLRPVVVVTPGAEIVNLTGDLTLAADWNLSTYRFGPKNNLPGILTLRASGDLIFNGALSDGFTDLYGIGLAYAPLSAQDPFLPINAQSWSYRLAAGADLAGADFQRVASHLPLGVGSLKLGRAFTQLPASGDPGTDFSNLFSALFDHYQVIRTGSGDIDIAAGGDVQLRNPFATIYTAGTQVADATKVRASGFSDFDLPTPFDFYTPITWAPQYSLAGGNVTIAARGDIKHQTFAGAADSERQLPTNWLDRRSFVGADGVFGKTAGYGDIASTTWWTDFSNFFEGIGTLGGGNVSLLAGRNIENVDAVVATNARMAGKDATGQALAPDAKNLVEFGGGDLLVRAGQDLDGGVYYVERGRGTLQAGNTIHTNSTRAPSIGVVTGAAITAPETTWLPTTLYLGQGSFDVTARGDIALGPVVNAFLTPQGQLNDYHYRTYFSTYAPENAVNVTSLGGTIDLRESATLGAQPAPILQVWMGAVSVFQTGNVSSYEPWIRLSETSVQPISTGLSLHPATFRATAFSGDINIAGDLTLSPAPLGTLELIAGGALNGLRPIGSNGLYRGIWDASRIVVSDANPASVPSVIAPLAGQAFPTLDGAAPGTTQPSLFLPLDALFAESGSTSVALADSLAKRALHDPSLLHSADPEPLRLYSLGGNIADLTLFSPKAARILAAHDLTDIGLYLQNVDEQDVSVVSAGRDIVAYNPNSPLLKLAQTAGNLTYEAFANRNPAQSGDLQITGPGTLEVLAGRNLDLGSGRNADLPADLGVGIASMGNARNPALPFAGARLVIGAGIGGPSDLSGSRLTFADFIDESLQGKVLDQDLPLLEKQRPFLARIGFEELPPEQRALVALDIFYLLLRDSGRAHGAGDASAANYEDGFAAIDALFGQGTYRGDIMLSSRTIKTGYGGDINFFAPGGGLSLGFKIPPPGEVPPGIITEAGGNISIFTDRSVQVGALRIFTLRGGNEMIWSSNGDIAAGSASKTVKTAPPTRVVIDAQSADVATDLAGLATGGGIGVLATRGGVTPGDVDLIAPKGTVDAGDAGIRATGNLNIAASQVLNADNIKVGGTSTGVPAAPTIAAPNLAGLTAGSNAAASSQAAASDQTANQRREQQPSGEELPSVITVEVLDLGPDPDGAAL